MAYANARGSRYKSSATYGDLAYDLNTVEREYGTRRAGENVRREAVPAPQVRSLEKVRRRERQKVSLVTIFGFGAVLALMAVLLLSHAHLTEVAAEVVQLKADLAQLQDEQVTLTAQYEKTFDQTSIKEAAERAGMTRPSNSQIFHIDLSGSDNVVVYQQDNSSVFGRILTSLNHGVCAVVEYFD